MTLTPISLADNGQDFSDTLAAGALLAVCERCGVEHGTLLQAAGKRLARFHWT